MNKVVCNYQQGRQTLALHCKTINILTVANIQQYLAFWSHGGFLFKHIILQHSQDRSTDGGKLDLKIIFVPCTTNSYESTDDVLISFYTNCCMPSPNHVPPCGYISVTISWF